MLDFGIASPLKLTLGSEARVTFEVRRWVEYTTRPRADLVVVDEVLHADQEHVYSPRPLHREVLGIVPGKMEIKYG
jgi:hypothetical protein